MTNKPFLKICGITRPEDLQAVINSGADAVGFIAFPKSPRHIEPEQLKSLLESVDCESILKVGVFVDPSKDFIQKYIDAGLNVVQLHGSESEEFAKSLDITIWKALRLKDKSQISEYADFPCEKLLVDSFVKDSTIPGGTGHVANWTLAKKFIEATNTPVLLAGGLKAENLAEAYESVKPFGFDLSSGVEDSPGIKSQTKINALTKSLNQL
ncbi:MAG: phosphoribosylanthranilate isomerase [Lentisphaeraceae bacterium]|nr:phosphoribosylanthranilate isomerase [Lentisphaeraceae bacterium]